MNSGSNGLHSFVQSNYQGGSSSQSRPEYRRQGQQQTPSSPASSYIGLVNKVPPTGNPGLQSQSPYTQSQAGQNKSRNKNATGRPLPASGTSTPMPVMGQRY